MWPVIARIPTPFGDVAIHSYGAILGVGVLAAWSAALALGRRHRLDQTTVARGFVVTAVFGLLGARLVDFGMRLVVENDVGSAWLHAGLAPEGAVAGGALALAVYLRRHRLPSAPAADVAAPVMLLVWTFASFGCWLDGSDFGTPLPPDAPAWLEELGTFPRWHAGTGSPAWAWHVRHHDLAPQASASLPVHPVQLYGFGVGALLVIVTVGRFWLQRGLSGRRSTWLRPVSGQLAVEALGLFAIARLGLASVAGGPAAQARLGLSAPQWLAMVPLAGAAVGAVVLYRRARHRPEDSSEATETEARDATALEPDARHDEREVTRDEPDSAVPTTDAASGPEREPTSGPGGGKSASRET
jgi:phosphatidylglycerol:prolipoprotein diacylglycerol transferase